MAERCIFSSFYTLSFLDTAHPRPTRTYQTVQQSTFQGNLPVQQPTFQGNLPVQQPVVTQTMQQPSSQSNLPVQQPVVTQTVQQPANTENTYQYIYQPPPANGFQVCSNRVDFNHREDQTTFQQRSINNEWVQPTQQQIILPSQQPIIQQPAQQTWVLPTEVCFHFSRDSFAHFTPSATKSTVGAAKSGSNATTVGLA